MSKDQTTVVNDANTAVNQAIGIDGKDITVHWSEENETILVEWGDIAQCYKWLSSRAHTRFSYMHALFTIPTITFSTISGTASFAQASIPLEYQTYAPMFIGTINILIGILSTIQQYLKISELNEAHRISSISWDKFARNIRIELAKIPEERIDAGSFIKMCRQEFDRLMETSPPIPDYIVKEFIEKFKGKTEQEQEIFKKLKKPDICDTIVTVNETRHKWYIEERKRKEEEEERKRTMKDPKPAEEIKKDFSNILLTKLKSIRNRNESNGSTRELEKSNQNTETNKKQQEEEEKEKLKQEEDRKKQEEENMLKKLQQEKEDERKKSQIAKIEQYIDKFIEVYNRRPFKEDIIDNLKNEISDQEIFDKFFETYNRTTYTI